MGKHPDKIYLQVDEDSEKSIDWFEGVTWCQDRINDTDIEYIRVDLIQRHLTPAAPDSEGGAESGLIKHSIKWKDKKYSVSLPVSYIVIRRWQWKIL